MTTVNHLPAASRRDRARATRLRMLAAAHSLFVEFGYAAVTMEAIAAASGVAVQTVYYTFKTKSLLLREVIDLAGAGPQVPGTGRQVSWMNDVLAERDADRALALAVEHGADIYAGATPLWSSLLAASVSDPDVEAYIQGILLARRTGMAQLVRHLEELGYLRTGLSAARATDIVFALFSHETYLALARDAGWSVEEVKAWFWSTLRTQLSSASDPSADVLEGLSFSQTQRRSSVERNV